MTTFPHRVIRMCIFQQLVYIHQIQDLLLTTKATTKTQSTCQLFLEINHVVSTSDQLMPSHSQLTKSTTNSYNISPPCFLVLKRVFKDSKAITAKVRSCTSNTTLLADDSQNCVSLEHLMIKISKSANFNNTPWLPLYSKTQYVGNPIPLSCTAIEIHPIICSE